MTELEKDEIYGVLDRLTHKVVEVNAMMKDGKFIVAYEKIGGIGKVIGQLAQRVATSPITPEA